MKLAATLAVVLVVMSLVSVNAQGGRPRRYRGRYMAGGAIAGAGLGGMMRRPLTGALFGAGAGYLANSWRHGRLGRRFGRNNQYGSQNDGQYNGGQNGMGMGGGSSFGRQNNYGGGSNSQGSQYDDGSMGGGAQDTGYQSEGDDENNQQYQ